MFIVALSNIYMFVPYFFVWGGGGGGGGGVLELVL